MRVLDVAELTAYLKDLLESDPILGDVLVRGEISNFTRSAAGHHRSRIRPAHARVNNLPVRLNHGACDL